MTLLLALQLINNKVSNSLSQICESSLRISPAKKNQKVAGQPFFVGQIVTDGSKKII